MKPTHRQTQTFLTDKGHQANRKRLAYVACLLTLMCLLTSGHLHRVWHTCCNTHIILRWVDCLFQKPTTVKIMPQRALSLSYVSICQIWLEKKGWKQPPKTVTEDSMDPMPVLSTVFSKASPRPRPSLCSFYNSGGCYPSPLSLPCNSTAISNLASLREIKTDSSLTSQKTELRQKLAKA